jgi:hypothetical protein
MTIAQIKKAEWKTFFDQISKSLEGNFAEIELNSLAIGNQVQTQWTPLFGISYDKKKELIEVFMENLGHQISKPDRVFVDQQGVAIASLEIIDEEDTRQIIKLRRPLSIKLSKDNFH